MSKYNAEYDDYYNIVGKILKNKEFEKRKKYRHHGDISVYEHSLSVSILSYNIAKKVNILFGKIIFNEYDVAISGLLHDFYYKPYTEPHEKKKFFEQHGFVHAREAMENSKKYFPQYMNKRVENSILRHMFPLNIIPPRYIEGWLITIVDKYVSCEVFPYLLKKMFKVVIKWKIQ